MSEVQKSLRSVVSFRVKNPSSTAVRICFFPAHYDTSEIIASIDTGKFLISYANPSAINESGYECVQVADDYNAKNSENRGDGTGKYPVIILPKGGKTRYRDFLNKIKFSGLAVTKIRITDMVPNGNHEIFGQDIEIAKSTVGSKGGVDVLNLPSFINPSHFLQNFIDIDLGKDGKNLTLDETTLMFMEIPAGADFQMDYTLAE